VRPVGATAPDRSRPSGGGSWSGATIEQATRHESSASFIAAPRHLLLLADQPKIFDKDKEGKMQQRVVTALVREVIDLLRACGATRSWP